MNFCRFLIFLAFLCSQSNAHTYYVGGEDGWTLKPSENYNQWADKHQFQINDILVFEYEKGDDSVLVVSYNDYAICNKENPLGGSKNGHSVFKFKQSGHFYFISGHGENCEKGQKFEISVLSPPHYHRVMDPSPSPTTPSVNSSSPSPSPEDQKPTHNTLLIPPSTFPEVEKHSQAPSPSPSHHISSAHSSTAPDFRVLFAQLVGCAIMVYASYTL